MGYNTIAVILNDALSYGEEDPNLGSSIKSAVQAWGVQSYRGRSSLNISARGRAVSASYGSVISQDHADGYQVVVVHGNRGWRVDDAEKDEYLGWSAFNQMRECLERNGFRVTRRHAPKEAK